jgi:uncharacterized protein with HEPN domain
MLTNDTIRLQHMLDAAHEAIQFASGHTRADLDHDRMLVLSLVKAIEIIGEAAYRISLTARAQLQDIPWDDTGWYMPISTSIWTFFGEL